jgi:hypothetical protein
MKDSLKYPSCFGARQLLLVLSLAVLAGCSSLQGFPHDVVSPETDLAAYQQYFSPSVVPAYLTLSGDASRRAYRDEVVYGRMHAYDLQFKEFLKALSLESGSTTLSADLISLTLNGLGATVGGAGTKAALSAASGGVIGAKGAISKNLFYDKTLPAIIAQMEAQRTVVRAAVEKGLAGSDADYSLPKALSDLDRYDMAGSFPGAVNSIVQDAGTKSAAAQADINITRDKTFSDALPQIIILRDRVKALSDAQALAVARSLEPLLAKRPKAVQYFVKGIDPNSKRLQDGAAARTVLSAWTVMDERDAASQKQWADALDAATK